MSGGGESREGDMRDRSQTKEGEKNRRRTGVGA